MEIRTKKTNRSKDAISEIRSFRVFRSKNTGSSRDADKWRAQIETVLNKKNVIETFSMNVEKNVHKTLCLCFGGKGRNPKGAAGAMPDEESNSKVPSVRGCKDTNFEGENIKSQIDEIESHSFLFSRDEEEFRKYRKKGQEFDEKYNKSNPARPVYSTVNSHPLESSPQSGKRIAPMKSGTGFETVVSEIPEKKAKMTAKNVVHLYIQSKSSQHPLKIQSITATKGASHMQKNQMILKMYNNDIVLNKIEL